LDDVEQVVRQLLLRRHALGIEHIDAHSSSGEDVLDEVECKPTKTAPRGHDIFVDISCICKVQNGLEALSVPVDTGGNIGDDDVVGMLGPEESNLAVEVISLFVGRYSGVHDPALCAGILLDASSLDTGWKFV
jgi:hypothetical protein